MPLVFMVGPWYLSLGFRIMSIAQGLLVSVLLCATSAQGQMHAALSKLLEHHSTAEVEHMRQATHYRYIAELTFYSSSFLVLQDGMERAATAEEIMAIDLHQYEAVRSGEHRVVVNDPDLQATVILLSRAEFEALLLARWDRADREAYLERTNAVLVHPASKIP